MEYRSKGKVIMKKIFIGLIILIGFLSVFLTFNYLYVIIACQLLVYLFWRFVFEKRNKIGFFLIVLFAFLVILMTFRGYFREQKSMIRTVAPYAFYDMGDFLEIKGGWNVSDTKYESTTIICDKKLNVCSDYTARLVTGHLHIAPILWEVLYWQGDTVNPDDFLKKYNGAIIAKSADRGGIYNNSLLYIDRKNKRVFIVRKESGNSEDDWRELVSIDNIDALPDGWEIVERLQDTFYQRIGE